MHLYLQLARWFVITFAFSAVNLYFVACFWLRVKFRSRNPGSSQSYMYCIAFILYVVCKFNCIAIYFVLYNIFVLRCILCGLCCIVLYIILPCIALYFFVPSVIIIMYYIPIIYSHNYILLTDANLSKYFDTINHTKFEIPLWKTKYQWTHIIICCVWLRIHCCV